MADEMSPGEIARTFKRQDEAIRATNDRVAEQARESVSAKAYEVSHQAVIDRVIHLEQDTVERIGRIEAASGERHAAVGREIRDLKAFVEVEFKDLREELKAMRQDREHRGEVTWQKVLGIVGALTAIALIVAQIATSGGR